MGQANPLARVLDGLAPDPGIPEFLCKVPVELVTDILDRAAGSDDERFIEICLATMRFEVHPHEPEAVIDRILCLFKVIPGSSRDHQGRAAEPFGNVMLDLKETFLVHEIDLVDRNERRDVDAVALDGVDEVVLRCVPADQDVGVHHLALGKDRPDFLDIKIERPHRVEPDAAMGALLDGDVGFRDIDPYPGIVEFLDEHIEVPLVEDVHENNDNICPADHRDDFLATPFSHRSACDETGDIEQLDLCPLVFKGTGNDR